VKIAVYSPTIFPVIDGTSIQANRQIDLLSSDYQVKGFSFAVDRNINYSPFLEAINDKILRLNPDYIQSGNSFPVLNGKEIGKNIKKYNPDILHIRGWYQFNAIENIIDSLKGNDVGIYWHTDGQHECHSHFSKDRGYREFMDKVEDSDMKFIGQTNHDFKILNAMGMGKNRYFQIPPILPNCTKEDKDWNNPVVFSLARFFDYKGHEKVYDEMQKINHGSEVLLAGASDSEDSDNVINRLRIHGASLVLNPSNRLVNELYNQSTHFVLASDRETLGIAALEAVLFGCIPIVKRNMGISSYLPSKFIYEEDGDLRAKLEETLPPKVASTLSLELNKVREELSSESVRNKFDLLYRKRK
jgi:hypothetical protein